MKKNSLPHYVKFQNNQFYQDHLSDFFHLISKVFVAILQSIHLIDVIHHEDYDKIFSVIKNNNVRRNKLNNNQQRAANNGCKTDESFTKDKGRLSFLRQ